MRIIHGTAAAIVLAASLVGASAWAQGAGAGGGSTSAQTTKSVSPGDQSFFDHAYQQATANVAIGRLAERNGATPQVKQLGTTLVDDATNQLSKLRSFAEKTNATIPSGLTKTQQDEIGRLSKEKGAQFDQAFLAHVRTQRQAEIGEMEQEAKNGQNPELKTLASNELPVLRSQIQKANAVGVTAPQGPGKGQTAPQPQGQSQQQHPGGQGQQGQPK